MTLTIHKEQPLEYELHPDVKVVDVKDGIGNREYNILTFRLANDGLVSIPREIFNTHIIEIK